MSLETRRKSDRDRQQRKRERDAAAGLASSRKIDECLVRAMAVVLHERHDGKVGSHGVGSRRSARSPSWRCACSRSAGFAKENPRLLASVLHRLGDTSRYNVVTGTSRADAA